MDVLGFKEFKDRYGDVLDTRAREGEGVMTKADFLTAIAEPFRLTFTQDKIKRSFELVGLHPFNPEAITPAMMAPSRATSLTAPLMVKESSPLKKFKEYFSDALEATAPTPPTPVFLTDITSPHSSVATSPPSAHYSDCSLVPIVNQTVLGTTARDILAQTHAHWIISDEPATSADRLERFETPPDNALLLPCGPNASSSAPQEPITKNLPEAMRLYINELEGYSKTLLNIVKTQRIQIGLDGMALNKLQQQVYRKEQGSKKGASMTALAAIATEATFIDAVKAREDAAKAKKTQQEANKAARAAQAALKAKDPAIIRSGHAPYYQDLANWLIADIEADQIGIARKQRPKRPLKAAGKGSRGKGKAIAEMPEELDDSFEPLLHTRRGTARRNYCEDSDSDYYP